MSGTYEGVKFETLFRARRAPDEKGLDELRHWCRIFHEKGLAPPYEGGSYGNLSMRCADGKNRFVITGSRMGLKENPGPEAFVKVILVDMDALRIQAEGLREPSSETMLHHAIYAARPETGAIFHGHCPAITEKADALGLVQTERFAPYGTREMVEGFLEIIGRGDFLLLRDHGFVGMGRTMEEAGKLCLERLAACAAEKNGVQS